MDMAVAEAAERLGVIEARVYAMLRDGELKGRRVSGVWLIDESELLKPRKLSRPMSARVAWSAILGVDRRQQGMTNDAWALSQPERSRLNKRLRQLHHDPKGAQRLAGWLAGRAERVDVSAPEPDALFQDPDWSPPGSAIHARR
jgi:excisionase family DNA binding protein